MSEPRRHHWIPRSLVRNWSSGDGDSRVALWQLDDVQIRPASPGDAFLRRDLYTAFVDDGRNTELEARWGAIESEAMPGVHRFVRQRNPSPDDRADVIKIISLTIARSPIATALFNASYPEISNKIAEGAEADADMAAAFADRFGRAPEPGEISTFFRDEIARRRESNVDFVNISYWGFHRAMSILEGHWVQRVEAGGTHARRWALSDVGVMVARGGQDGRPGRPIAMGDADEISLSLGPKVLAAVSKRPVRDLVADHRLVVQRNRREVAAANRSVITRLRNPKADMGFDERRAAKLRR